MFLCCRVLLVFRLVDVACCVYQTCSIFFFFKQKTAYEMRISDWSSDVCSSDLAGVAAGAAHAGAGHAVSAGGRGAAAHRAAPAGQPRGIPAGDRKSVV